MPTSLSNAKKAVIAAILLLGAIAALVVPGYDVDFTQAVVVLAGPVFGVIGVLTAKTFSPETFEKTLQELYAAVAGVLGFFITIPASTEMKVSYLIVAIVGVFAVAKVKNSNYTYGIQQRS